MPEPADRHRLLPYAILVPGPVAAGLIAVAPEWAPAFLAAAVAAIVGGTLRLLRRVD